MKSDDKVTTDFSKLSLLQSLRYYWANVWLAAVTPLVTALAMEYFPPSWRVVFIGLILLSVVVPYRFGKAPMSYVVACGLIYLFLGSAIAFSILHVLGIDSRLN